jgi:hypothetical protein
MRSAINIVALVFMVSAACANAKGGGGAHFGSGHSYRPATGTGSKAQSTHVSSYTTSKGSQVGEHNRSTRDTTKTNNWSTKGSVNPDTGKPGTK